MRLFANIYTIGFFISPLFNFNVAYSQTKDCGFLKDIDVIRSTVRIISLKKGFNRELTRAKIGTGVIIDKENGIVLTSGHIVNGSCNSLVFAETRFFSEIRDRKEQGYGFYASDIKFYIDSNLEQYAYSDGSEYKTEQFKDFLEFYNNNLNKNVDCDYRSAHSSTKIAKSQGSDLAVIKFNPKIFENNCEVKIERKDPSNNDIVWNYGYFSNKKIESKFGLHNLFKIEAKIIESNKFFLEFEHDPISLVTIRNGLALAGSNIKLDNLDGFSGGPLVSDNFDLIGISSYTKELASGKIRQIVMRTFSEDIAKMESYITE